MMRRSCWPASALVQRWLAGVGPAAIAALLAVSIAGLPGAGPEPGRMASMALALAVICVARLAAGGIAVPTLAGALAYALLVCFQPW